MAPDHRLPESPPAEGVLRGAFRLLRRGRSERPAREGDCQLFAPTGRLGARSSGSGSAIKGDEALLRSGKVVLKKVQVATTARIVPVRSKFSDRRR